MEDSLAWYTHLACGAGLEPLREIAKRMRDISGLRKLGFLTKFLVPGTGADTSVDHLAVIDLDWMAMLLGTLAMRQIGRSMVENSWHVFGFPGLFPALLDPQQSGRILDRMRRLWYIHQTKVGGLNNSWWRLARQRSVFNDAYVLKVLHVCCRAPRRSAALHLKWAAMAAPFSIHYIISSI